MLFSRSDGGVYHYPYDEGFSHGFILVMTLTRAHNLQSRVSYVILSADPYFCFADAVCRSSTNFYATRKSAESGYTTHGENSGQVMISKEIQERYKRKTSSKK